MDVATAVTGRVIWITGLSGAGKSTLAAALAERLRQQQPVVLLDGDRLRSLFDAVDPSAANHGREARLNLALRYARLCAMLAESGVTVVIATISMFHEVHDWNRRHLPGYLEVYLKVPLAELRRRDPKGIYARHAAGELQHVAGLDLLVDEPRDPHLLLLGSADSAPQQFVDQIVQRLYQEQRP